MGQTGIAEPIHNVTVSSFWIDTTEVTQADYTALIGANPSQLAGDTNNPVEQVSWYDAARYCNARSKKDRLDTVYNTTTWEADFSKNGYRLPTEAEWEYACRAGTATEYFWGSGNINSYAWHTDNSGGTTHPVAGKLPNAWGLYDMSGNVWEWCHDRHGNYNDSDQTDPTGASSGSIQILRGGAWDISAIYLCSAYRYALYGPAYRRNNVGFRVALSSR